MTSSFLPTNKWIRKSISENGSKRAAPSIYEVNILVILRQTHLGEFLHTRQTHTHWAATGPITLCRVLSIGPEPIYRNKVIGPIPARPILAQRPGVGLVLAQLRHLKRASDEPILIPELDQLRFYYAQFRIILNGPVTSQYSYLNWTSYESITTSSE